MKTFKMHVSNLITIPYHFTFKVQALRELIRDLSKDRYQGITFNVSKYKNSVVNLMFDHSRTFSYLKI